MKLFVALLFLVVSAGARGADVVALCIGNNAYARTEDVLDTPIEDATLMKKTLEALPGGADVIFLTDATKEDIELALNQLKIRARNAKLAMVFYSGHGMDGQPSGYDREDTFLIPVDAEIQNADHLGTRTVALKTILTTLAETPVTVRAVILDCCRTGAPKATGALVGSTKDFGDLDDRVKQALGKAVVPDATLIAFAASPGRKAAAFLKESDINSPFTAFLAEQLRDGSGHLRDLVERAAEITEQRTERRQVPYVSYLGSVGAIRQITFRSGGGSSTGGPLIDEESANFVKVDKQDLASMKEELEKMKMEVAQAREEGHKPVATTSAGADGRLTIAESSLYSFIARWFRNQKSNSAYTWASDFADSPRYFYFRNGTVGAPRSFLVEDRQKLINRYSYREYEQIGKATVEWLDDFTRAILTISFHYEYSGTKNARGNSFVTLHLANVEDEWKIEKFDEDVRKNAVAPGQRPPQAPPSMPAISQGSGGDVDVFVAGWARNNASNDPDEWVSDFDSSVDYCYKENGPAGRSFLRADRAKLINKYPNRSYRVTDASFDRIGNGNIRLNVTYSYQYGKSKSGSCDVTMLLRPANGRLLITSFREKVKRY
ncbi:MAG TPA: caspase family protein [Bacteroidia bacterium]|nr:caspase family protein [Bacteroidia bacterium]